MENLWEQIAAERRARRPIVVATIVAESGSVPRRTGAKMLVYADGRTAGTIGGGIFEVLVVRDALGALQRGASVTRSYSFNPKGTDRDAFGAVCGGRAEVFLEVIVPGDRMLIVGGGHCGRALAAAASLLDFSIILADDREEYARAADYPFANVEAVLHLPADFEGLPAADAQTYVVLVSKGFLTDAAALQRVIDSPAAYIGMIGSQSKREAVFQKLREDCISDEKLARVFAPIGLEIGAESPAEIAVSILAEIVRERARIRAAATAAEPRSNGDVSAQSANSEPALKSPAI
jgi:xanthine dehydrogenase accessory factor